jgi:hypothetical protein
MCKWYQDAWRGCDGAAAGGQNDAGEEEQQHVCPRRTCKQTGEACEPGRGVRIRGGAAMEMLLHPNSRQSCAGATS